MPYKCVCHTMIIAALCHDKCCDNFKIRILLTLQCIAMKYIVIFIDNIIIAHCHKYTQTMYIQWLAQDMQNIIHYHDLYYTTMTHIALTWPILNYNNLFYTTKTYSTLPCLYDTTLTNIALPWPMLHYDDLYYTTITYITLP